MTRSMFGFVFVLAAATFGQTPTFAAPATEKAAITTEDQQGSPSSLAIYFRPGSSELSPKDKDVLDHASRAYNEGKPIVMILSGTADRSGNPRANLTLSQKRATAVLNGLIDRGIPAERFQVLAKGETELPVPTARGIAESKNRRVEISWH